MKALNDLRRFIIARSNAEEQHEIREYVKENIADLARDFCVTTGTLQTALDNVPDDSALACRLLETIRQSAALQRDRRKAGRAKAAQASADALASVATWSGDQAEVDILSILSSCLTKQQDLMVFTTNTFIIAVYQAVLFDLVKLKKRDLTAVVDAKGLHMRWKTGGLNLVSQIDAEADRIVMSLPAKVAAVAAQVGATSHRPTEQSERSRARRARRAPTERSVRVSIKVPIYRLKLIKDGTMQVSERVLDKPFAVARVIERWVGTSDREHLVAIFLDADRRIVGAHVIAVGSLDHAHTTAREVFKAAIVANAHGLILGHNHPSGSLDPSESDIRSTKNLIYLGTMLGIRVLDHVIVSRNGFRSMHEMGLVPTLLKATDDESEAA
jgi:DNA repair protein RadC